MNAIRKFFEPSDHLEHEVLRPLSHIHPNWDLYACPHTGRYIDEEESLARLFNYLIDELATTKTSAKYHESEDQLAKYVKENLHWDIHKQGNAWVNVDGTKLHPTNYLCLLEQGGFKLNGDSNLVQAAAGRVNAAVSRNQKHFDDMEHSHQVILAGVLSAILYHRTDRESSYRNVPANHVAERLNSTEN